jgi:hypothetical protein
MAQVIETVFSIRTEESIANLNEVVGALGRTETAAKKAAKSASDEMAKIPKETKKAASGFNGLANSINQVSRELPAFAFSAQTGFLAVSNNIPILIDEINNLRKANAALAAEGKATVPVFQALATGIFSWQTAMSLAISFSVLYAKEIGNLITELRKGKIGFDAAAESIKLYYQAFKGTEVQNAITDIERLKIDVDLAKEGFLSKKAVLTQYNETVGKTTGKLKNLAEVEDFLVKGGDAYIKMTLYKAAANLALEEAAKSAYEAQIEASTSLDVAFIEAKYAESLRIVRANVKDKKELAKEEADIEKRKQEEIGRFVDKAGFDSTKKQKEQIDIAKKFMADAAKISQQFGFSFFDTKADKEKVKTAEQLLQEALDKELNAAEANYVKILETKVRTDKEKEEADLDYLDVQIAILERYANINKKYIDDYLNLRKQKAQEEIKINQATLAQEYKDDVKFMEDTINAEDNAITERYTAIRGGREKTRLESLNIDLKEVQDRIAYYDKIKEADKKYSDKFIDLKKQEEKIKTNIANEGIKERSELEKQLLNKGLEMTSSISNQAFDLKSNQLKAETDLELKNLQDMKDKKLITEEEFKTKSADIKNQAARKQREYDLAQIQVNTALAIIKALATAPTILAGIPLAALAGIEGAIQYAFASAQPLPQFAKGTERVTGGIAGKDSVHALLMPNEAVIPAKANMERQGLAKAWISGDLDKHLAMNYINPAINEVNRKWETSLKLNQQSTFIRNDSFNDKKIVGELVKSNRLNRALVNSLSEGKTVRRNKRIWN